MPGQYPVRLNGQGVAQAWVASGVLCLTTVVPCKAFISSDVIAVGRSGGVAVSVIAVSASGAAVGSCWVSGTVGNGAGSVGSAAEVLVVSSTVGCLAGLGSIIHGSPGKA